MLLDMLYNKSLFRFMHRSASPISDREKENNGIGLNLDYVHIIQSLKEKQNNEKVNLLINLL
jgi:hypothetical protein